MLSQVSNTEIVTIVLLIMITSSTVGEHVNHRYSLETLDWPQSTVSREKLKTFETIQSSDFIDEQSESGSSNKRRINKRMNIPNRFFVIRRNNFAPSNRRNININVLSNIPFGDIIRSFRGQSSGTQMSGFDSQMRRTRPFFRV